MLALLILVKENRCWQAWTIFIPALLLTQVIWPLFVMWAPGTLYSFCCFSHGSQADFAFNSLIGGWTALWLMAPWLARCRPATSFALALSFLLIFGVAAHDIAFSHLRSTLPSTLNWWKYLLHAILWYGTCAMALVLGMAIGAMGCRSGYRPRRFLAWLAIGTLVAATAGTLVLLGTLACDRVQPWVYLSDPFLLARFAMVALGVATFVYSIHLPFLYLAHRSPCYRERMQKLLRLGPLM